MATPVGTHTALLPAETHVGSVRLGVSDLQRSLTWYDQWFGLAAHEIDQPGAVGLAPVGGNVVLELVERPGVQPFGGHHTGLYHYALRVPTRGALARWLAYAAQNQLPLVGAADHFVSEAIYLTDPDGHSIEIYWDRPRSTWEGQIQLMTTASLDINDLFSELDTLSVSHEAARVPAATDMGHVHLQVADVDATVAFLRDVLGFELMLSFGRQAVFMATGGYHHDVGANTWASRGAQPAPDNVAHLEGVMFSVPSADDIAGLRARVGAAGLRSSGDEHHIALLDPSGNPLSFTVDTSTPGFGVE
jgi:catechol 2,3-dioxygenase